MERLKIIEIKHSSESYSLGENEVLKNLVLNDWNARVARQIKKYYPEIEVECWSPERLYDKEERYEEFGVLFRFFPVTFGLRYALDFSYSMIRALRDEVDKSKREGYKLIIKFHEVHNLHGLLVATLFKDENVFIQHHGGSWPMRHLKNSKNKRWFFPFFYLAQIWENAVLKNIKNYYVLSKEEMDYLKGVAPNSKVRFQTMGIEEEYFEEMDKGVARRKLGLDLDKKIILFIGKLVDVKGIGYLLEAMKELKDVELKVIGFSPEEGKFKDYVKRNALKNVEFLGGVFGEEKLLYLSAVDALVLPSLKEGAPVTVMEALARNTPVVVTDVGGVPLMIEDGREGVIIRQGSYSEVVRGVRGVFERSKGGGGSGFGDVRKYAEKYRWKEIIQRSVGDFLES